MNTKLISPIFNFGRGFVCLALVTAFTVRAHAAITGVEAWYRLGEADPGGVSGLTVTNTTTDSAGTQHLKQFGSPLYTNNVSASASNHVASSLAVRFSGSSQYLSNDVVSTLADNFGIEAWVKVGTTNASSRIIAYNGSTTVNGWGLVQSGNLFRGFFGNGVIIGSSVIATNVWTHLALVRNSGSSRLYVNGSPAGSSSASAPVKATDGFAIATAPESPGSPFFNGAIDEVRVFRFAAGQFATGDLLVNAQRIPVTLHATLTDTNVILNGRMNPLGVPVSAWFEWGATTNYGNVTPAQALGSGVNDVNFIQPLTGLTAGDYHYRTVASNSLGVVFGNDDNFSPPPPTVATLPASAIGNTNATLNGVVNPVGVTASGWFEWGTTTNYGNITPAQALGNGVSDTNYSQVLNGLFGGTHNFRAVASNIFGITSGTNQSFAIPFFALATNLISSYRGGAAWGDYDNDGRLDLLVTGLDPVFGVATRLYRNLGGSSGFEMFIPVPGVTGDTRNGAPAWGDYDNDGQLDILLAGTTNQLLAGITSQIWRNNGFGGFYNIPAAIPGVVSCSVAWGDFDNDGRADALLSGYNPFSSQCGVWRNTPTGFINALAGMSPIANGAARWGDFDNDGRLDVLAAGIFSSNTRLWRNTGGHMTDSGFTFPYMNDAALAWADYDGDGRLDFLLTGRDKTNAVMTQLWRNTGGGFTNVPVPGLPGVCFGAVAWGDYDNDGRPDFLLTGATGLTANNVPTGFVSQVWQNLGTGFTNIGVALPGVSRSAVAWGDYDNDGRLDFVLAGATTTNGSQFAGDPVCQVWHNQTALANTPPSPPSGLFATGAGDPVTFSWNAGSDAQTPAAGLTYNLRIGTTPGGSDIVGPMAASNGWRRVPEMGNRQQARVWLSAPLPVNIPLYWSVQSVDTAFAGSGFAPEASFKIQQIVLPVTATNILIGDLNGDGLVDQSELNTVLSNYFPNSPWLYMTNVAGLGGTNVTFALSNSTAGAFSVEYTTNLVDWQLLGPATPRYLFTDTNAPAVPQRYYRLRWP